MARPIEPEDLFAAWRALGDDTSRDGWRTISVGTGRNCQIRAGRHFPGNEEAVLVGLRITTHPMLRNFPSGFGFSATKADLGSTSEGLSWFSLIRQPAGKLDFFAMMAADVITALNYSNSMDDEKLLAVFLERVRAWQRFMEKESDGLLSPEAEVGLHGELVVLTDIIRRGVSPDTVVNAWTGPLDGLQDFSFEGGAIEVKASTSQGTFPAMISSLDQLDYSTLPSLFLAGVRLMPDPSGVNILQRAEMLREILKEHGPALSTFETRLLHAGLFPGQGDNYTRTFSYQTPKLWKVQGTFPKLTHGEVPSAIRKARYEIDLDLVTDADVSLQSVLQTIGVV